jgi:nitrate reductase gamma subunit
MVNRNLFLGVIITAILCFVQTAEASWLIDADRFYNSSHGQMSCIDCHDEINAQDLHPDPGRVNANLRDLIEPNTCLSCHEYIPDDLEEGIHGGEKVEDPEEYKNCLGCHDPHYLNSTDGGSAKDMAAAELSLMPEDDRPCMSCHRAIGVKDTQRTQKHAKFCFHCHAARQGESGGRAAQNAPQLDLSRYPVLPHAKTGCLVCHPESAQYGHSGQPHESCRSCHTPHEEKVANDAHMGVACEACHLGGVEAVREPDTGVVLWKKTTPPGKASNLHDMAISSDTACERCHFKGNHLGAASMLLPAKSVICMPCHAATLSFGDTVTAVALLVFLAGFVMTSSLWLSGSMAGFHTTNYLGKALLILSAVVKNVFSGRFVLIAKSLFFDVLLQRRLYRRSVKRWIIHSLIFFPFIIRFIWGIAGLFTTSWLKDQPLAWALVDKNHPVTALLFDVTGVMIGIGIVMAFIRRKTDEPDLLPGLPKGDRLALCLIGGIVLIGFILESLRIAMTGTPTGSGYSVIGYGISRLFSNMTGLSDIYGYVWYLHAIVTGAFIAYLPFSRLKHIIMAPVVLIMDTVSEHEHQSRSL